ncbi:MAG: hypothetical protein IPK64_04785 [bacterium]|nr:hypothetical protein [bacterium]
MNHRCPDPATLAALLDLPEGDERRREAAACPRCDAVLRSLSAFMAGDASIPAREKLAAERHLSSVVAGLAGGRAVAAAPLRSRPRSRASSAGRRWGWTAGLAAAAALVILLAGPGPLGDGAPNGRLRGGSRPAAVPLALEFATAGGDSLAVAWSPAAGAEAYGLELYTAELDTIMVLDGLRGTSARVAGRLLPLDGRGVLCRVRAYARGREVAASALVAVPAR